MPSSSAVSPDTRLSPRSRRIFITVAEVSGDAHAAQLIRSIREIEPTILIEGVGGPEMAAAGAIIHQDTVTHAAMGWRGALRAGEIYRLLRWTRRHFAENRPDLWIGVDSPSMNFHFAKAARRLQIPTLQYVAPQLWAWASWRMGKLRSRVDQVACILPFEEDYFRKHGVNATFVGHPLFDELPPAGERSTSPPLSADRPPVVGLLPGSRRSVARANFPHMLAVADYIRRRFPDASFLVPTTASTDPIVREVIRNAGRSEVPVVVGMGKFDQFVPRCDLCLTVSGTATLHVAGFGVPMIVVYRGGRLLWNLVGRWLIRARTYALVNLLANPSHLSPGVGAAGHLVPEVVPWHGPPDKVGELAIAYLQNPQKLAAQREGLAGLIRALDHPGASNKVARLALDLMERSPPIKTPAVR